MKFTQHIIVHAADEAALRDLVQEDTDRRRAFSGCDSTASGTTRDGT